MFSTAYFLLQTILFSHIDLSQCYILSKILWLKQAVCGMELPPLLFCLHIYFQYKCLDHLISFVERVHIHTINITVIAAYIGRPSNPYHPKTWTNEVSKVVHVSCCFHKLVRIGTRTL